ncbi:Polypyrimidine tract-binding protein-like protein 3 [Diplonema papillatum]|nr:Polypyrimidine tract-binding protein-like protein 3 [Diplonema papillatum]KAJ9465914.1 Polypyrimidine tract-binding protein-like protein 3 [Diplonema papillatum]
MSSDPFQGFKEGVTVEVRDLQKRPELNGLRGMVICVQEDEQTGDRLVVRLPTGDCALRPQNCVSVNPGRNSRERGSNGASAGSYQRKRGHDDEDRPNKYRRDNRGEKEGGSGGQTDAQAMEILSLLGQTASLMGSTPGAGSNGAPSVPTFPPPIMPPAAPTQPTIPAGMDPMQAAAALQTLVAANPHVDVETLSTALMLSAAMNNPTPPPQPPMNMNVYNPGNPPAPSAQQPQPALNPLNLLQLLGQIPGFSGNNSSSNNNNSNNNSNSGGGGGASRKGGKRGGQRTDRRGGGGGGGKPPGCCLLVVMRRAGDATTDDVFWIFSQFGVVEKLSLFIKDTNLQALVQYEDPKSAQLAMGYLNGRDVDVARAGEAPNMAELAIMLSSHVQLTFPKEDSRNKEYYSVNAQIQQTAPEDLPMVAAANGWNLHDFVWGGVVPGRDGWLIPRQPNDSRGAIPRVSNTHALGGPGHCVLLTGLPTGPDMTAHRLWGVAGVYGELVAVKILQKRNDHALIQYIDENAASVARESIDGVPLFGYPLECRTSKNSNALNWRGARSGLENFMCTTAERAPPQSFPDSYPPCEVVIIREVPQDIQSDSSALECIRNHFQTAQSVDGAVTTAAHELGVRVQMASIEDAFSAVCSLNGTQLALPSGQSLTLKLAFGS